jgi:hypothetical protein
MKTLYLKDSGNRRKEFALTTRICIKNGKKIVLKEPCFPEGIPHLRRIVESQHLFEQYYKNVEISKTWIENDILYSEYIEGTPLSDFYIKAIQKKDKIELTRIFKTHLELMLGQDNICNYKTTNDFVKVFKETLLFEGESALKFTFFEAIPENIIFINGDISKPCFIDYEWSFNFPVPVSLLKFTIALQLFYSTYKINNIFQLLEILEILNCPLSVQEGMDLSYQFEDFVYKDENYNFSHLNLNKEYEKKIFIHSDFINKLTEEQNNLLNSRSWRITKPLRVLGAFIRRNKFLFLLAKSILFLIKKQK